jgi:diguanylate cyclase (GGDEF)-like protein
LVALSAVVAIIASTVALWLVFFLTQRRKTAGKGSTGINVVAAAVLGLAIFGMHYTGMAAAHFADGSICGSGTALDKYALAYGVSLAAVVLLASALSLSILDAHLTKQREIAMALRQENQALSHKAQHDHLTGLPNRSQLEERLADALEAARAGDMDLAVLFMDLDGFKAVNDSAGHATGDVVLTAIAQRLTKVAGRDGFVSRVSGDEFVLVLQGLSVRELEQLCVRLLDAVRQPVEAGESAYAVSGSLGIALRLTPFDDVRTMLTRADQAMYEAKKSGKNGFRFADGVAASSLAKDLERGLRNREFTLLFQPTVDAVTLAVTGAEALVRWNHPERGLVPPNEFIPQAEELGLIEPLGDWILQDALAKLAEWQAAGYEQTLAVNLSPVQLQNEQFPLRVRQLLSQYKIQPEGLIFEVTETFAMADVERCRRVLAELQDLGVLIAVDDFGTGYSSLSHLYRLPVGELKIDKSFVQAIATDAGAEQICSAMVALAHSLKLTVVAEGVETPAQQAALKKLGCDTLQGYRFGKPMTWQELQSRVGAALQMLKAA